MSKYDEFDLDIKSTPTEVGGITPQSGTPTLYSVVTGCETWTSACDEVSVTTPCGSSKPLARC